MSDVQQPKVGVGVMIFKDNKILLGKRKNSHGKGEFAFPGGHLEYLESFRECAKRETLEECGVEIENINFQFVANIIKYKPGHYTHIGLIAKWKKGIPKVLEPNKCESWNWYDLNKLPSPLFEACKIAFKEYKDKNHFYNL